MAISLVLACSASAQTPAPTPSAPLPLRWGIYSGFYTLLFTNPDPFAQSNGWALQPGVVPSADGEEGIYDVCAVLEASGVTLTAGSTAIFSPSARAVVLHMTQPNLDLFSTIIESIPVEIPPLMKVTVSIIEYSLPALWPWKQPNPLAYAELEKLENGSINLLDRATISGMSGAILTAEHILRGQPHPKKSGVHFDHGRLTPIVEGETGIRLRIEPAILPDQTIRVNFDAAFRILLKRDEPKSAFSGNMHSESLLWNGCPIVAQSFSEPGAPGRFLAIVLQIDFVNPGGWKLPVSK